ncbi:MAG: hypothetical protein HYW91_00875 [Candidatus Sungbacteria bacterium]|nr:hypothetical protein [Candidatus Sungbacteria bacterium]
MSKLIIGVPCEVMVGEGRVPIFPETAARLKRDLEKYGVFAGFMVESGLGRGIGLRDGDWKKVAAVVPGANVVYGAADIILGVKQPLREAVSLFRRGQGSCCFQHVRANEGVVRQLLEKGVKLLPMEANKGALYQMSRAVGGRIRDILDRCYNGRGSKKNWIEENILITGARGTVGRHCIDNLLLAGVDPKRIHACDIVEGWFETQDTAVPRRYETFSIADEDQFMIALQVCGIEIIAALDKEGRAPKIHEHRHLAIKPHRALIIQVNIDEGGSINDERFCKVTFWDDPVYEVMLGPKAISVCNVPDIPGCIRPEESSRALVEANHQYYLDVFRTWPEVPERFLFREF